MKKKFLLLLTVVGAQKLNAVSGSQEQIDFVWAQDDEFKLPPALRAFEVSDGVPTISGDEVRLAVRSGIYLFENAEIYLDGLYLIQGYRDFWKEYDEADDRAHLVESTLREISPEWDMYHDYYKGGRFVAAEEAKRQIDEEHENLRIVRKKAFAEEGLEPFEEAEG